MHPIIGLTRRILPQVSIYLDQVDDAAYARPLDILSGSSIGTHTRHILDGFTCLLLGMRTGRVCYDDRERDARLETSVGHALETYREICTLMEAMPSADIRELEIFSEGERTTIQTSLAREVLYNIDHLIHHLAIIRIAVQSCYPHIELPEEFGVAPSTLEYWKQQQKERLSASVE